VGGRFPLHATGVGLALLAHAPAEDQDEILARPLERFTEKTLVQPDRLRRALADVRRTGVAVSDGQVTLDALSVAAPVFDGTGDVAAALSIVVNSATANPATLAPVVRAAALGVSRSLRRRRA
jgi:DNA-binding IclR family transcriptional regulator